MSTSAANGLAVRQHTRPPFLWITKTAAPLLLSKSVVGGTAVRRHSLHRTPPEAENPGRVRSPGRHPIPTRRPPLLVCPHQNRDNASAIVNRRLAQRRDSNQPSSAPAASPQAKMLKLLKRATSPATNFSTRRTNASVTFGLDQIDIESGPAGRWYCQMHSHAFEDRAQVS